jgi:glyoxylase-like metal-dependent hydrolase (beta-lactamase superfamily II)
MRSSGPNSHDRLFSRRGFLQGAAAATFLGAAPEYPPGTSAPSPLGTSAAPRRISDNLFVLEDSCNVYLIRDGHRGVLIDFGSGRILDHLTELGVTQIDWILHTHHHRDQAQGDQAATARGIPIAVPAHERHLFEDVERLWANRRIFELYQVRNDFFSLMQNVRVNAVLRDYEVFRAGDREFIVQPSPGHTIGSISLLTHVDGRLIAFTGDLIQSSGKTQTLYDLQYYYQEHEGVDFALYSLTELAKLKPEMLCPSHGKEMEAPQPAMAALEQNLRAWYHYWKPDGTPTIDFKPLEVSPHLIAHPLPTSTFYAILSKSGKVMLIDYGSASWNFFASFRDATDTYDRMRFVEHSLEYLQSHYGVTKFDVAMPSHIHDDHVNGFPFLVRKYGTRIWCYENMAEIFANPRGRNTGCVLAEPIPIERTFKDGERFTWEEYEFTILHSPGHTDFEMALFAEIDGSRIGFTGDAFFNYDRKGIEHNLIYRNDVTTKDYQRSISNLEHMQPEKLAPGHGEPFLLTPTMLSEFKERIARQTALIGALVADPVPEYGMDPSWVQIYPYQAIATAGERCRLELRVRNHRSRAIDVQLALCLPAGWTCEPAEVRMSMDATSSARSNVDIFVPRSPVIPWTRKAIAADVKVDGVYLGQIAEAVVDVMQPGMLNLRR